MKKIPKDLIEEFYNMFVSSKMLKKEKKMFKENYFLMFGFTMEKLFNLDVEKDKIR